MVNLGEFFQPKACGQTVLPDNSLLMGQKLIKIGEKCQNLKNQKCDIFDEFQNNVLGR